jgi:acetyltransferase-like isoleucine patch superfamily enzyme
MKHCWQLDHDWYRGGIPVNVEIGREVYIDSSYAFAECHSRRSPGVKLGDYCGIYDRATLVVGAHGQVRVGEYSCLNGTYIICQDRITIGAHCLLSWGVVITDSAPDPRNPFRDRSEALCTTGRTLERCWPRIGEPRPVSIEDNVWIGFDAVVLPGVKIGSGSIIGCKTIVDEDIAPYSIVAGNPARVVRKLAPDDTEDARQQALQEYLRA